MGFFNRKQKNGSAVNGADAAKNEMLEAAVTPEKGMNSIPSILQSL